ncbi:hypothetical protein VCCP1035_1589A, partial [Vibrio cholerae CP1035(8)]
MKASRAAGSVFF